MSENVDLPVEEVSPEIYRRRRIAALLVLVFILLLIIGLISLLAGRGKNTEDASAAAASASTSAAAFSDFSERPSESASASQSAKATESSAAANPSESASKEAAATESAAPSAEATTSPEATPSVTPSENPVAAVACTAADLQVSLTADRQSYAAGQNPALAVTYTNTSGKPCIVTGGANNVDVNIISGPAQVFNYAQCYANPVADAEVAAGATNTTPLTWNRSLNVLGCNTTATIQPGYYWATASVNGVTSQPVRIIVTG